MNKIARVEGIFVNDGSEVVNELPKEFYSTIVVDSDLPNVEQKEGDIYLHIEEWLENRVKW